VILGRIFKKGTGKPRTLVYVGDYDEYSQDVESSVFEKYIVPNIGLDP
jgi:hypothetical protein